MIQTSETDKVSFLFFVFACVWADRMHEEHHDGPESLRRRFPIVPESAAQKSRSGGGAPEPGRGDDPEPEEGACLHVCMSQSERRSDDLRQKVRKHLGK